jgi:ligand-binding sensor domain-containing protein
VYAGSATGFDPLPNLEVETISCLLVDGENIRVGTPDHGVYTSHDGGETWQADNRGLEFQSVACLADDPTDRDAVVCGTEGGLFRQQGDEPWRWITQQLGLWPARAVACDAHTPGRVYAGGVGLGGPPPFIANDGEAAAWRRGGDNLPDGAFFDLQIRSDGERTRLYAATTEGVRVSEDAGQRWHGLGKSGPKGKVFSLALTDTHLFAAGEEGVFRMSLPDGPWHRIVWGMPRSAVTSILTKP